MAATHTGSGAIDGGTGRSAADADADADFNAASQPQDPQLPTAAGEALRAAFVDACGNSGAFEAPEDTNAW